MFLPSERISLDKATIEFLESLANSKSLGPELTTRLWVILMAAEGIPNYSIARTLLISRPAVLRWRARFERQNLSSLKNKSPGRKKVFAPADLDKILEMRQRGRTYAEIASYFGVSVRSLYRFIKDTPQKITEAKQALAQE